jgi:hypothetical protein
MTHPFEQEDGVYDPQTNIDPWSEADVLPDPVAELLAQVSEESQDQPEIGPDPNEVVAPNKPEFAKHVPKDEQLAMLARALYGASCPLAMEDPQDLDWVSWARDRWNAHHPAVERHLWLIERNRLFRAGQ